MGLDWNPGMKPLAGHEAEFTDLFRQLREEPPPSEREKLLAQYREVGVPAYASLGAPRIGIDAAADQWLREQFERADRIEQFEAAKKQNHGVYVLDLLPWCDGFARYSNYPLMRTQGYERYTFRAQFLLDTQEVIGEPLLHRAYEHMLAPELAAYADALDAATRPWAEAAGVAGVERAVSRPDAEPESPRAIADILFNAIRWCRFWSSRGHGLEPWY